MPGYKNYHWGYLLILAMILSACNYPGWKKPGESGTSAIYTAAAQTQSAQLTQVSQPPETQPLVSPFPSPTVLVIVPSPTFALPTLPPATATPLPSPTPVPCDLAEFSKDVSYPDNSQVAPGAAFVKTWRIKNIGSCAWNADYDLVFTGGTSMGSPAAVPFTGNVPPGGTIDLSVSLTSPVDPGTYRGEYKLRNPGNVIFGLGKPSAAFWVQIVVPGRSGLLLDFISSASTASWFSSSATEAGVALSFNGPDDNAAGVAKIKDGVKLETGATSGKVLLTYPRRVENGAVTGMYPGFTVQKDDHFKARLGFMIPEGSSGCGDGKVKFQLLYQESGADFKVLREWSKTCDTHLLPVDVDLSGLKGKTVTFALVILADGPATDDWAIWNSPRIEH